MEEFERKVSIQEVSEFFNLTQVTGDELSLQRTVSVQDINRPGLELSGFYDYTDPKRIVIFGDKEISYIRTLSKEVQCERFNMITDHETPAIIIAKQHEVPEVLIEICKEKNFPLFKSEIQTSRLMVDLISYLDEKLAPVDTLHGVLINVYGKGVLITGDSGVGKSEIALELIKKGHILVADDRVDVHRIHNKIIGQAPELLRGFLEIRGIGIIDIVNMFGASFILSKAQIDFVVYLEKFDQDKEYARVGTENEDFMEILDFNVPRLVFPVKEGRNMAVLVESAVTNFSLKQMGMNGAKKFDERVYNYIKNIKNNEKH